MKKILLTTLLFLAGLSLFAGDKIEISSGVILISNPLIGNMGKTVYKITFDAETEKYQLVFEKTDPQFVIELTEKQLKQLMRIMDKYREWEQIAVKNQVEIDKPIPDGVIKTTVYWLYRGTWHTTKDFDLRAQFLSQDRNTHHLKLSAQKVWSPKNKNIDFDMDDLYFIPEMALTFNEGISEERIRTAKEEYKKQKEAGSLFY